MPKNLFEEIEAELGLATSDDALQKEASDPLLADIYSYLANHSADEDSFEVNEEFGKEASVVTPVIEPTTLTATMIGIEKEAGEKVFPDQVKSFVFNAEELGYSTDEIEEYLSKEAGLGGLLGLGISGAGHALAKPFRKALNARAAKKGVNSAIEAIHRSEAAPAMADQAVANAMRLAGKDIKAAPSLMDRITGVVNPNHFRNKRLIAEGKLRGTMDDIISADNEYLTDPRRMQGLISELTFGRPTDPTLQKFMKNKLPKGSRMAMQGGSGAENLGASLGTKWDAFKRGKNYNKALAAGGGGGLAYLMATRDKGSGQRGRGSIIVA
ncbi:MAG: hypothetical protein DRN30_04945 [Thermoplasmata archaeon]|nr:MAG: hypothetical protein DRN30_04945 [Thermoplasmata archaeon]